MSRLERIEQATAQDVENVKELVRQNGTESFCNAYALVLKQNTTDAIYARYLARFDSTDEMTKNFKIEIR